MSDSFESRHLGPRGDDIQHMLDAVGAKSVDALVDEIIPADIRLSRPLALPAGDSEAEPLSSQP